jgi:Flp pilus assembly protein TadG
MRARPLFLVVSGHRMTGELQGPSVTIRRTARPRAVQQFAARESPMLQVRRRPPAKKGRGQSFVEFALVLPLLLFLLLGTIDFGRVFFTNIAVANAARAGAIRASQTPMDYAGIAAATGMEAGNVVNGAFSGMTCSTAGLVTTCQGSPQPAARIVIRCQDSLGATQACPASPQLGVRANVGVSVPFNFITPFISAVFQSGSLNVSSAGVADELSLPTPITSTTTTSTSSTTTTSTSSTTTTSTSSTTVAMCMSPSLDNLRKDSVGAAWSGAGFAGTVTEDYGNSPKDHTLLTWYVRPNSQTVQAGGSVPCTSGVTVSLDFKANP